MHGGIWRARRWLFLTTVGVVFGALWAVAPPAGAQDDGLRVEASTVYRVLPDEFAVEVEITYSVTNQVPDRTRGFTTTRTFFEAIFESIPVAAVDVQAVRSNGSALELMVVDDPDLQTEDGAAFQVWQIDLGPNLFYRQTRDLTVTYRLPDGAARDLDAWARVNPAFFAFFAFGRGDDGLGGVRIEVPDSFDVELFTDGDDLVRLPSEDGVQAWELTAIAAPYDWSTFVIANDDGGLDRTTVEVDGVGTFSIASWPGDTEWVGFVTDTVTAVGPFLEEATGLEWPHDDPLEVVETVVPALAGYAGVYFEPRAGLEGGRFEGLDAIVEIGEDLNAEVLSHEIAHSWFNREFSRMRWLTEGFAEYFGQEAAEAAGVDEPERFPPPSRNADSFDLLDWGPPDFSRDSAADDRRELFGYSASYFVIDSLSEETGEDGMRAVIDVLVNDKNPHDTDLELDGDIDWRRTFDAFEVSGGAESTEALFTTWVFGDRHEDELAERRSALERRDDVAAHQLSWVLPDLIAELLGDWRFEEATDLLGDVESFLDAEADHVDDAAEVGVSLPGDVRDLFETVDDVESGLEEVELLADVQRSTLGVLAEAQATLAEPRGFVQNVGLRGLDPDADLDAAFDAFEDARYEDAAAGASDAADQILAAEDRGTDQLVEWGLYTLGGVVVLLSLLVFWRRRRKRRRAAADAVDGSADEQESAEEP